MTNACNCRCACELQALNGGAHPPASSCVKNMCACDVCRLCSTHKEPLGHTISRGYQMPAGLGTEVPFGRPLHVKVGLQTGLALGAAAAN
jgi:hypothetical protein